MQADTDRDNVDNSAPAYNRDRDSITSNQSTPDLLDQQLNDIDVRLEEGEDYQVALNRVQRNNEEAFNSIDVHDDNNDNDNNNTPARWRQGM